MKQPLMLTQNGLPPAQAEALYETTSESAFQSRSFAGDAAAWPGEDWEDETNTAFSSRALRPLPPISAPLPSFTSSAQR